jgi:hypothetical protein
VQRDSVEESVVESNEDGFSEVVERTRAAGDGDIEVMTDALYEELADANEEDLIEFQTQYVAALNRMGSWRHVDAVEMVCGFVGDDFFVDYRTWVLTRGREVFEQFAAEADALADIPELDESCKASAGGEPYGAVAGELYTERTGDYFPDTVPSPYSTEPTGKKLIDHDAIRAALPRLAARYPDDGLGGKPIER